MLRRGGACGPAGLPLPSGPLHPPPLLRASTCTDASRAENLRLAQPASGEPSSGAEAAGGNLADVELLSDLGRLAYLSRFSTTHSASENTCISAGATAK